MKTLYTILIVFFFLVSSQVFSQSVIFTDDFESGTANAEWGTYYSGEDELQAVAMGFRCRAEYSCWKSVRTI